MALRLAVLAFALLVGTTKVDALVGHVGDVVTLEGTMTAGEGAHLIQEIAEKRPLYLRLLSGNEVVVYVAQPPGCAGRVELVGKVFVLAGTLGKTAAYAEPQLDVERWRCLLGAAP